MIPRSDLTAESTEIKSNPNDFYIDARGRVNQLEDDEERILFGTVANPSLRGTDLDAEEKLWVEAERDARIACDPEQNPHLKIMNVLWCSLAQEIKSK